MLFILYHELMSMMFLTSLLYNFERDSVAKDDSPSFSDMI